MYSITATDLPRLMACPGSRLMGEAEAPTTSDNTVRNEGVAADWLVQQVHSGRFLAEELIDRKSPNGVYIEPEMVEYLEEYMKETEGGQIEVTLNNVAESWRINGRADLVKYQNKQLLIGDLKYGWRAVEPEENWTLISHAMAWCMQNPSEQPEWFTFAIYQPRAYHPEGRTRYWSINNVQMQQYFDQILHRMNLFNSNMHHDIKENETLQTGDHCLHCPAFTSCAAARKAENNCIDASHRVFTDTLTNDELSARLDELHRAEETLKRSNRAFKELATHRLKNGEIVKNYSVENELTNRQIKKDITADFVQMMTGIDATNKKLMTPAQMEKAGVPKEFVATMTERRNKGIKLVRISAHKKAQKLMTVKN